MSQSLSEINMDSSENSSKDLNKNDDFDTTEMNTKSIPRLINNSLFQTRQTVNPDENNKNPKQLRFLSNNLISSISDNPKNENVIEFPPLVGIEKKSIENIGEPLQKMSNINIKTEETQEIIPKSSTKEPTVDQFGNDFYNQISSSLDQSFKSFRYLFMNEFRYLFCRNPTSIDIDYSNFSKELSRSIEFHNDTLHMNNISMSSIDITAASVMEDYFSSLKCYLVNQDLNRQAKDERILMCYERLNRFFDEFNLSMKGVKKGVLNSLKEEKTETSFDLNINNGHHKEFSKTLSKMSTQKHQLEAKLEETIKNIHEINAQQQMFEYSEKHSNNAIEENYASILAELDSDLNEANQIINAQHIQELEKYLSHEIECCKHITLETKVFQKKIHHV